MTHAYPFTPPPGCAAGDVPPSLDAMVKFDHQWRATCPECRRVLVVYDHDGGLAFWCHRCDLVWPIDEWESRTSHRSFIRAVVARDRIVPVAEAAA